MKMQKLYSNTKLKYWIVNFIKIIYKDVNLWRDIHLKTFNILMYYLCTRRLMIWRKHSKGFTQNVHLNRELKEQIYSWIGKWEMNFSDSHYTLNGPFSVSLSKFPHSSCGCVIESTLLLLGHCIAQIYVTCRISVSAPWTLRVSRLTYKKRGVKNIEVNVSAIVWHTLRSHCRCAWSNKTNGKSP